MKKSLADKLDEINSTFDTKNLLQEKEDLSVVKDYYKTNKISYRLFHNWSGFLHMGLSENFSSILVNLPIPKIGKLEAFQTNWPS